MRSTLLVLFLLPILSACTAKILGEPGAVANDFCAGIDPNEYDETCQAVEKPNDTNDGDTTQDPTYTTSSWDFSVDSLFDYNSNFVEISDNKATVKQIDSTHSGSDFDNGTHVGTSVLSEVVTLNSPMEGSLSSEWTPHYDKLISYWPMDNNWNDSIGAHHGNANGDVSIVSNGLVGNGAGYFDGDNDYLLLDSKPLDEQNQKYTISAFIKSTSVLATVFGQFYRAGNDNNHFFAIAASGSMIIQQFPPSGGDLIGSQVVNDGEWHHVAVVMDGSKRSIYVDGSLDAEDTSAELYTGVDTDFWVIGGRKGPTDGGGVTHPLNGTIDELAIWNEALSPSEISLIYQRQSQKFANDTSLHADWTPKYNDLVGYWKMDGNWQDSSGNGIHLTRDGTGDNSPEFAEDNLVGSGAGQFDGVDDHAEISHSSVFEFIDFSFCAWFKKTNTPYARIVSKQNSWILGVGNDGTNQELFWVHNKTTTTRSTGVSIPPSTWNHGCFTRDTDGDLASVYLNGVLIDQLSSTDNTAELVSQNFSIGGRDTGAQQWPGQIDDVAIWSTSLTGSDILLIYNRQKQKYAGHYESPIVDLGESSSFTAIQSKTTQPFYKELVPSNSESSSEYSSVSGDLVNGLIGYWNFAEKSLNTVSGNDFEDHSENLNHGVESDGVTPFDQGVVGTGLLFDGVDDYVTTTNNNSIFDFGTNVDFSISTWVKMTLSGNASQSLVSKEPIRIFYNEADGKFRAHIHISGTGYCQAQSTIDPVDGSWHHITVVFKREAKCDDNTIKIYIDGVFASINHNDGINSDSNVTSGESLTFGKKSNTNTSFLFGNLDEIAIWNRILTDAEIQQLYRRGANRVKYQVKSCIDSSCNCKSYSSSPAGSSSDCDGDGTPNATDYDDIHKADFIGPGGDGTTYYSELFNRDSSDLTFQCDNNTSDSDDNICVDDEVTLAGSPKATAPSFTFSNMADSATPSDNRYFQYRVYMEAEDNTACDGEPCLPELESVTVTPSTSHYGGDHVVKSSTGLTYSGMTAISITEVGFCGVKYQISPDGSNYYYYSSGWKKATAESKIQASLKSDVESNISSFVSSHSSGTLHFKAIIPSVGLECGVSEIEITQPQTVTWFGKIKNAVLAFFNVETDSSISITKRWKVAKSVFNNRTKEAKRLNSINIMDKIDGGNEFIQNLLEPIFKCNSNSLVNDNKKDGGCF